MPVTRKTLDDNDSSVVVVKYGCLFISILSAFLVWPLDVLMDSAFFYEKTFVDELLNPSGLELYFRLTISLFVLIIGISCHFGQKNKRVLIALQDANTKLHHSEQQLRESQSVAKLGGYRLDVKMGLWESSIELDCIFGIGNDYDRDILGWLNIVHPEDQNNLGEYLSHHVLLNHQPFNKEYKIIRVDDRAERWVHGLGELQLDAAGNPECMIGTIQDITERKHIEEQLLQSQKMEAVGTLVGGIAHDFNNMLAGITGNLFLAKKKLKAQPDVMVKLDMIETISFRAGNMVQQLLTFARKEKISMKCLAFAPFMNETLKFLHSSVPENIIMHEHICSGALSINADSTQLHQVLINLIINAVDALEGVDEPSIHIHLESFSPDKSFLQSHEQFNEGVGYAHLSIIDNGCGIPKERIRHLFEPFFTTKEQGKGTGLGLAMVFGAIEMHQGYIEVDSIEGKGSTFHIYIPLHEAESIEHSHPVNGQRTECSEKVILLVDDDQSVRETTAEVLESMGHKVLKTKNGLQGIEMFEVNLDVIDLALLDVVMPHMGGKKLAEEIRLLKPNFPIIFMTGYDKDGVFTDEEQQPVNTEMITKPIQFTVLDSCIRQSLI